MIFSIANNYNHINSILQRVIRYNTHSRYAEMHIEYILYIIYYHLEIPLYIMPVVFVGLASSRCYRKKLGALSIIFAVVYRRILGVGISVGNL